MRLKYEITARFLKWIAVITMCFDHVGAAILEKIMQTDQILYGLPLFWQQNLGWIDDLFRLVGRLSFPIFVFLLVEGMAYSRNRKKYFLRLLVFALISEIPFDMAVKLSTEQIRNGQLWQYSYQNVFFTLALGLLAMCAVDRILRMGETDKKDSGADRLTATYNILAGDSLSHRIRKIFLAAAVTVCLMALAYAVRSDYGAIGILVIVLAYSCRLFRREDLETPLIVLPLFLRGELKYGNEIEIIGMVDWLLFRFYNGKQGNSKGKYFFYIFYPAHLLLLALIRLACGIG